MAPLPGGHDSSAWGYRSRLSEEEGKNLNPLLKPKFGFSIFQLATARWLQGA
jgi:hypothetical protein